MSLEYIQNAKLEDTGFNYTMSLIQGKYKMYILYTLMGYSVVRFNEMKKYIGTISYKTLSATLKELEADGLVHREEYPQIPPKVEYSLTERGKSLIPILDQMCTWGEQNRQYYKKAVHISRGAVTKVLKLSKNNRYGICILQQQIDAQAKEQYDLLIKQLAENQRIIEQHTLYNLKRQAFLNN